MGQIIGTIGKAILLAVVGSAATILVNRFMNGGEDKIEYASQFDEESNRPQYRF